MLDGVNIWGRLEDLFTRIPVEEVGNLSDAAEQAVKSGFHFAQAQFWLFVIIAYLGFALVFKQKLVRSGYLMLASLFFYWKVGAPFVWILVFSTVIDFFLGKAVYSAKTDLRKKLFISVSMVTNLGMLAYFKYFNFFATEWNSLIGERGLPDWMHIMHAKENAIGIWLNGGLTGDVFIEALPMVVGISYFTFQTMSYTIDIYRGQIKPLNNIIDFGFFVSFFPQLVAGPIVRASEFVPQIHNDYKLTKSDFGWSLYMILKGLIKKMVFADYIAVYFLDYVFADPGQFSGMANVIAIFGYSLQIYGDFAGYTDMAIGVAKLFGYQLPTNFNSPYKATHCGGFWKRWHITLSSWLKDYLYIPLGGNRGGTKGSYIVLGLILGGVLYAVDSWPATVIACAIVASVAAISWYSKTFFNHINTNVNISLTMLLGGLWHGASWQFVIWGGLNGIGVLSSKYWNRMKGFQKPIAALIVAVVMYVVKVVSGADIWIIAVFWALVVAAVSAVFSLVDTYRKEGWNPAWYYTKAIWGMIHTLFFITFTRVYFRGESMDKIDTFYNQILHNFKFYFGDAWLYADGVNAKNTLEFSSTVFAVIILGYLIHWVPTFIKKKIENTFISSNIVIQGVIAFLVVVMCYQAYSSESAAFIYYAF